MPQRQTGQDSVAGAVPSYLGSFFCDISACVSFDPAKQPLSDPGTQHRTT